MGKQIKYVVGQAYQVAIALFAWLPEMNGSRDVQPILEPGEVSKTQGVKLGVFESLMTRGWSNEFPAQAIVINDKGTVTVKGDRVSGKTADYVVKQRKAYVESLKDEGVKATCKAIWCDAKGNYIRPELLGNSGFTRGLSLPAILTAIATEFAAKGKTYDASKFTVACIVKEFADETERLMEQSFENESRTMAGVSNMGWADLLKVGRQLLDASGGVGGESLLQRAYGDKRGTAQKAFAILTADGRFPSLKLIERIKMAQPDKFTKDAAHYVPGGYLPVTGIPQQAQLLRDAATVEDAENFLKEKVFGIGGTGNAPKVLAKPAWEALGSIGMQDGSPMAAIAHAHLKGVGFGDVKRRYPELFKANCVLGLADDGEQTAKPSRTKARSHAGK